MESSMETNIKPYWEEVVANFKDVAGIEMNGPAAAREEMKEKIDNAASSQQKEDSKELIKKSFTSVLDLGKVASDAASTAFPPTGVCYQAVVFLVDTVSIYQKYYTVRNVTEVLRTLTPHLESIESSLKAARQGARVSLRLQRDILEILAEFIQICTIYAKIKKDSKSVVGVAKMVLKAAARYDGNISVILDKIGRISKRMDSTKISEVHESSLMTESDRIRIEHSKKIKDHFLPSDRKLSAQPWVAAQEEHRKRFKNGTGAWLSELDEFCSWRDIHESCMQPVLCLSAAEGRGKSHLVSEVIDDLIWRYDNSDLLSPPVSVAYFYFEKTRRPNMSTDKTQSGFNFHEALSAVIWQFTENDAAYQNFVYSKVRKGPVSSVDLWTRLILGFKPNLVKTSPSKTFFIILDGVNQCVTDSDQDPKKILQQLIGTISSLEEDGLRIRILFSCGEEFLNDFESDDNENLTEVNIRRYNDCDIRMFINAKLDGICARFQNNSETLQWREKQENIIFTQVDGDFVLVNLLFNTIGTGAERDEVDTIIDNQLSRSIVIKHQLERLEKTLNKRHIDDLNELLAWVVYMYDWPTVEVASGILRFKSGRKSVQDLSQQITKLYSQIFDIEDDLVVANNAMDYFTELDASGHSPVPNSSSKEAIPESEINLVQGFVKNLCGTQVFDRFGFQQHFDGLRSANAPASKQLIQCNFGDAHRRIASVCLQSIVAPHGNTNRVESLDAYTVEYLFRHLKQLQPGQERREEVIRNLGLLIAEDHVIVRWLKAIVDFDVDLSNEWLSGLDKFAHWFDQHNTDNKAGKSEHESEDGVNNRMSDDLLALIRKVLARRWLYEDEWGVDEALKMVLVFYRQKQPNNSRDDENMDEGNNKHNGEDSDEDDDNVTMEAITRAKKAAAAELQIEDQKPQRYVYYYRLAETLLRFHHTREATVECQAAIDIDGHDWRAHWCMARAEYASASKSTQKDSHYEDALLAIGHLDSFLLDSDFQRQQGKAWEEIIQTRWTLYDKLKTPTNVQEDACIALLDKFPDHAGAMERFLKIRSHRKVSPAVRSSLASMLYDRAESEDFHKRVYRAFREQWEEVKDAYSGALKKAEPGSTALFHLRYYYGLALFYLPLGEKGIKDAMLLWEKNLEEDRGRNESIVQIVDKTTEQLVYSYISSAKKAARRPGFTAEKHIDKIRQLKMRKDDALGRETHYLTLLLGRAYTVAGQKEAARECVRKYISAGVELLSDDISENDGQAYLMLSEALTPLEDDVNARAALLMFLNLGYGDDAQCDGACGNRLRDAGISTMSVCRDCVDVGFDDQCFAKLGKIKAENQVCGKDHDYLHYTKEMAERAKGAPSGFVLLGDKQYSIHNWLEKLKAVYLKQG